jgi:hypothetical protein
MLTSTLGHGEEVPSLEEEYSPLPNVREEAMLGLI